MTGQLQPEARDPHPFDAGGARDFHCLNYSHTEIEADPREDGTVVLLRLQFRNVV
jgi:hypothetical protein